jgi:uncharacterized repeat protein (TIGR03803 family)
VLDAQGNLYGNTRNGGADGSGTVFKLTPNQDGSWSETVLYSFTGGADGESPRGSLLRDAQGNLYGDTKSGGDYGYGTLFKLDTTDQETVLYSFTGGTDGNWPGNFVRDAQGNLYGTTSLGGTNGAGIVFKLNSAGAETVLYNFCSQSGCADGRGPGSLVLDAQGNLYGATGGGGAYGDGTVFELTPDGTETVLYNFTEVGGSGPGTLIIDLQGGVYGITGRDGVYGNGTVFELTPDGTLTVLYNFTGGADGGAPQSLIMDAQGNFYGTTGSGGAHGYGTVFKLTP